LRFDAAEHPVVLQLGGSEPDALARCAAMAADAGYDAVNLNCGCPSDRVQRGRFGACLMAEPELVRDCLAAMREATERPVTVKCRIGVDDRDDYADLLRFVDTVALSGCTAFVVHARKAWLLGLSPKQNREVPPLRHALVARLKRERPQLTVAINGGITEPDQARRLLADGLDGVMLGRLAYQEPCALVAFEAALLGHGVPARTRHEVIEAFLPYVDRELTAGTPLPAMTRHVLGLFNGLPGARAWRRLLSEDARRPDAGPELLRRAAAGVPQELAQAA
jgi:tRNA-dihydrouridine synthase A